MVIGRLETYDVSEHPPKVAKRIRVAATTPVNLNISAASLETLIETSVSWNRQTKLETISSKRSEVVFYLISQTGSIYFKSTIVLFIFVSFPNLIGSQILILFDYLDPSGCD